MTEVTLRDATTSDLPLIARCHRSAFPKSLSTAMGLSYLVQMLGWYLSSEKTFLFFLERDGECIGYCGGMLVDGKVPIGSASGMTQFSFNAAIKAIMLRPWLCFHPELLNKYKFIWKNIRMKFMGKSRKQLINVSSVPNSIPHAGLVVIGVDKRYHRTGMGSHLLMHFESVSRSKGFRHLLLTVLTNNVQAIRSYERNGWRISEINGKSTTMEKFLN